MTGERIGAPVFNRRTLLIFRTCFRADAGFVMELFHSHGQALACFRQLSMIKLMDGSERPYFSHPVFWAPFTFVGQGV